MRALLSIPALSFVSLVSIVAALGCATHHQGSAAQPQSPAPAIVRAPKPDVDSSMQRATRLEDHARPSAAPPGPVSLTGQLTYTERFDPSGWSGTSVPKAVGGGPVESIDDPYSDPGAPTSGTSEAHTSESAQASPPVKALEAGPGK